MRLQERLGNPSSSSPSEGDGRVFAVFDHAASRADELDFECGDAITVLRCGEGGKRERACPGPEQCLSVKSIVPTM